ncbi:BAG family molecular chaperone regulator 2 [Contarinia nasturtii]|uniref:BAG family molecular chaperone regulator 2 n=1 Tax=Contarinia nasturtii TaxID=265458 RepID=UPI0012D458A3|nr:BAG family molecular chaperone regulator 2 [Contarinia nasturtii]
MDVDQLDTASMDISSVDFQQANDENVPVHQRFINALDHLDNRVEKLRKEAMTLTEKRDVLLMSMDILKHNELLSSLNEFELDEVNCYAQRISNRLGTIEISVKTVRDCAQEDSLHQVNSLIDSLLTISDRVLARQRCQTFLNACCVHDDSTNISEVEPVVDKKFETAVLGCTLDDQKTIKKRLQALMAYLNKQTVTE